MHYGFDKHAANTVKCCNESQLAHRFLGLRTSILLRHSIGRGFDKPSAPKGQEARHRSGRDMLNQDEQSKAQSARAQEVFTADDLPRRF